MNSSWCQVLQHLYSLPRYSSYYIYIPYTPYPLPAPRQCELITRPYIVVLWSTLQPALGSNVRLEISLSSVIVVSVTTHNSVSGALH